MSAHAAPCGAMFPTSHEPSARWSCTEPAGHTGPHRAELSPAERAADTLRGKG